MEQGKILVYMSTFYLCKLKFLALLAVTLSYVIRVVLNISDARLIAIFPAGNDIDLKHRITIVIFNILFKF